VKHKFCNKLNPNLTVLAEVSQLLYDWKFKFRAVGSQEIWDEVEYYILLWLLLHSPQDARVKSYYNKLSYRGERALHQMGTVLSAISNNLRQMPIARFCTRLYR